MPSRETHVDHLRTVMTALVLYAHAGMTYGGEGSWFYREVPVSHSQSSILFSLLVGSEEACLMGLFFLLAGYFTPRSFDRKGWKQFLFDRILRLGIPFLAFGLIIAPLTIAIRTAAFHQGFRRTLFALWQQKEFINGPMWFAEGLLFFSLGYLLWRTILFRNRPPTQLRSPLPSNRIWLVCAISLGLIALTIRQFVPADFRILGLWVATFPPYIFFFCAGIAARRNDWLSQLNWRQARVWLLLSCITLPTMLYALEITTTAAQYAQFLEGLSWRAILYAFFNPFAAFGIIAALLLCSRKHLDRTSTLFTWLDRRAYAVYIIHPLILVSVSLVFKSWHAAPLVKATAVGTLGCIATWLAADPLVRLPGLRSIV